MAKLKHEQKSFDSDELVIRASRLSKNGNKKKAVQLLKEAASLGNSHAQHNLGYAYDIGDGIRRNFPLALHWYQKAWESGKQADSLLNIGLLFRDRGETRKARFWLEKAYKFGDGDAALEIAKILMAGVKVKRSALLQAARYLASALKTRGLCEASQIEAKNLLAEIAKM